MSFLVSSLVLRLSSMVLFILVARRLGEQATGTYSLASTYTLIFMSLSFWGLDQLFVRDVSQHRELAGKYWINFGLLRLLLACAVIALLYAFLTVLGKYPQDTIRLIMLMGLTLIPDGLDNMCQAYFMAIEEMLYIPLASLALAVFRLAGIAVVVMCGTVTVETVIWVFLVASAARGAASVWLVLRKLTPASFDLDPSLWLRSIAWAFPFVFIASFIALEAQMGVVITSLLATEREVGLYGAAQNLVVALQMIPQAFQVAVFPAMSRLHARDAKSFQLLYRQSFFYLLVASLGLISCVIIVARDLIVFLYKQPFAPATSSLQILAISIVFSFLNIPNSRLMIIVNQQRRLAIFLGLGLVGNLIVSLALIPRFGFEMAAVGKVVSMLVFFSANSLFVHRNVLRARLAPRVARIPVALGASICVDFLLLRHSALPLMVVALVGLIVYAGVLIATNAFPQEDVQLFRRLLRTEANVR